MKGLIVLMGLVVLLVILAGASASAVSDYFEPLADSTHDDDTITCQTESPPSGTIGITMCAVDDESEPHADTATITLRARTPAY